MTISCDIVAIDTNETDRYCELELENGNRYRLNLQHLIDSVELMGHVPNYIDKLATVQELEKVES